MAGCVHFEKGQCGTKTEKKLNKTTKVEFM